MKVRIIKASGFFWYNILIGEEFEVKVQDDEHFICMSECFAYYGNRIRIDDTDFNSRIRKQKLEKINERTTKII